MRLKEILDMNGNEDYARFEEKRLTLENIIKSHKAQILSWGYSDIILPFKAVESFIEQLTTLGIIAEGVNLWCHHTPELGLHERCPHGTRVEKSTYFEGFFIELPFYEQIHCMDILFKIHTPQLVKELNDQVLHFIMHDIKLRSYYAPCLVPGLWLNVPSQWNRELTD